MMKKITVTRPSMPDYNEYIEAIKPLWDSHWITNMGKYHNQFEENLKQFLGVPEVSLMVNGHMALEMVIQAMNFPEGSEVITTPFTFISTTHAIIRNKLKPVFCDVKESDGTIDESKIEELITEKTVAIVPVHVYGNICNISVIEKIAYKFGLKVIYDAAHAFGETLNGVGVGSFGNASIFSFHATKVFNTVEGGAVTFSDHYIYEKLYNLKNFGIRNEELVVEIGANAKMNEFCAIMGLCNLAHFRDSLEKRKRISEFYHVKLDGYSKIGFFEPNADVEGNYAYFPILIKNDGLVNRDELYNVLSDNGVLVRKYFYPLTADHACFKNKYKSAKLETARNLSERVLILPMHEGLEEDDLERIVGIIEGYFI